MYVLMIFNYLKGILMIDGLGIRVDFQEELFDITFPNRFNGLGHLGAFGRPGYLHTI